MTTEHHLNENSLRQDADIRWHILSPARWPQAARMALVAFIAALSIVLIVPVGTASAEPPRQDPPPSSAPREPNRMVNKLNEWYLRGTEKESLDRHDRNYGVKRFSQIVGKFWIGKLKSGSVNVSWTDTPTIADSLYEFKKDLDKTPGAIKKRIAGTQNEIQEAKKRVERASNAAERQEAERDLEKLRKKYRKDFKGYQEVMKEKPRDLGSEERKAAERVKSLGQKIRDTRNELKSGGAGGYRQRQLQQRLVELERKHTQAEGELRALRGNSGDEDGDTDGTSGTRPTPRGPQQPPKGPGGVGTATRQDTGSVADQQKNTRPAPQAKPPFRPGRGKGTAQAIGEVLGEMTQKRMDHENQKLLESALRDPELRTRILTEFQDKQRETVLEEITRPFRGKEFTPGELRHAGPPLKKHQKMLDDTQRKARESNSDPAYLKARRECGGYETCVKERTKNLRQQQTKATAEANRKARESNSDPAYLKARRECGGYETCVKERTKVLREQQTKESAKKQERDSVDKKTRSGRAQMSKQ
ncbi:hypothetical protein ACH41E_07050 [Streptomyces sp. NPDC020412]|uniref:hypothetical protein n=1 Tax=Streptomyces sp. NPDC020412 TaxID=3365073 RepID=UPI00378BF57C